MNDDTQDLLYVLKSVPNTLSQGLFKEARTELASRSTFMSRTTRRCRRTDKELETRTRLLFCIEKRKTTTKERDHCLRTKDSMQD